MGCVFRPKYRQRTGRDPETGKPIWGDYVEADCWYIKYRTHDGAWQREKGFTSRRLTEKLLHQRETEQAEIRVGLRSATEQQLDRPITSHLDEYLQHLAAKENTPRYIRLVGSRLRALIAGCRIHTLRDFTAEVVERWLATQRSLPRGQGLSAATSNHYLGHAKSFLDWIEERGRLHRSPLRVLRATNTSSARVHVRRCLTPEEFHWLLLATAPRPRSGRDRFTGMERAMLYLVASYTGFRASELAEMVREDFQIASQPPALTLAADQTKNRKAAVIPLHADLAAILRDWLATRPASGAVWPGDWAKNFRGGKMLRRDLREARQAWLDAPNLTPAERQARAASDFLVYRNAAGKVFDFHALRGQFATNLILAGVPLAEAQHLLRHSDPRLTMTHYVRSEALKLDQSVARLPAPPPIGPAEAG